MKLAIHGGTPVRVKPFPAYKVIGDEEKDAVNAVLSSGILSRYLGCWHPDFFGGPEVQSLEKEWASYFNVKHAIAVNSATSGLYCAVGATGVEPGEEIIVSPYTMSASATAPLIYSAIPIFADIEENYFCLNPDDVIKKITPRTRAIIVVNLFGLPYDADKINEIARSNNLIVIEDNAQAPGAFFRGKPAGALGDIGVFSLNYHKHIHSGEGGIIVTNSDDLAEKMRLIRNHAEAVVENKKTENLVNMVGFNFRMTEIEATIIRCQLKKLPTLLSKRQENCAYLENELKDIPALVPPKIRTGCTHAFYVHPYLYKEKFSGISRDLFIKAVSAELPVTELREAEGPLISCGYTKPLYLLPIYQKLIAYGSKGWPFKSPFRNGASINYNKGLCPVAERMYEKELFLHELMRPPVTKEDLDDVVCAFKKVWENRHNL